MNDQNVVVVFNTFRKLVSVRRHANGQMSIDALHKRYQNPGTDVVVTAFAKAMRKYPKDEFCMGIVTSDLTVDQANDIIRWLNRDYQAQGYTLLSHENMC